MLSPGTILPPKSDSIFQYDKGSMHELFSLRLVPRIGLDNFQEMLEKMNSNFKILSELKMD